MPFRHQVNEQYLCLHWVLGRHKEFHLTIFSLWHSQSTVSFQVEMLLTTNVHLSYKIERNVP